MNRKGFAGGICIGLAALANMLAPHPVIGAILFCFGLFAIFYVVCSPYRSLAYKSSVRAQLEA
mgnify:CR=1 FL=1